jgi:hypothetical protein
MKQTPLSTAVPWPICKDTTTTRWTTLATSTLSYGTVLAGRRPPLHHRECKPDRWVKPFRCLRSVLTLLPIALRYKSYTTEGGIRVPCIAKFPAGYDCPVPKNGITHKFSTIMDVAPTFLEMAGISHPAPHYKGREIVGMRGRSMVPWLKGSSNSIHVADFVEGWEMGGRAAVRKGNWKAVYLPSRKFKGPSRAGMDRWELFDLDKDPGEIHDLSQDYPDKLKELLKLWDQYVIETGVVPLNPALGEYIAATEEQMPDDGWMEYEFWKKGARKEPEKFFYTPKRFDHQGNRIEYRDGGFQRVSKID